MNYQYYTTILTVNVHYYYLVVIVVVVVVHCLNSTCVFLKLTVLQSKLPRTLLVIPLTFPMLQTWLKVFYDTA